MKTTVLDLRGITFHRAYSLGKWIALLLDLAKIKISVLATFSTTTGYLLATGKVTIHMLVPTAAVFLLACGSCALNQYQEREIDRWMERTKSRPIPSGRLNPETALRISLGLILSGALILLCGTGNLALALGLFAVLWYNLIYTSLKQKTAFAAVPGALVGAIPPVLGWVAGGREIFDPKIAAVALFFFIWQIPHFWLLLLESSRDYEKAGLSSITKTLSREQIRRVVFVWLWSAGASFLVVPLFGFLNSFFSYFLSVAATSWLFWGTIVFIRSTDDKRCLKATSMKLNIYAVLVISILSVDRLLSS